MNNTLAIVTQWLGNGSINLFGCPFAGKDTQAKRLAALLNGEIVGGGDILRSQSKPKEVEAVLNAGGIVPHDFYLQLVLPYLSQPHLTGKPLILDAVGRASGEEPAVMQAAIASGHPLMAAIVLELPEDEVWRRFEAAKQKDDRGARQDDQKEIIKNRLQKYHTNTIPVLDYYRDRKLLVEIDGTGTCEKITDDILTNLARRAVIHA